MSQDKDLRKPDKPSTEEAPMGFGTHPMQDTAVSPDLHTGLREPFRTLRRLLDKGFDRWAPDPPDETRNWRSDADWAQLQQEPLRARRLLYGALITLVLLVIWAGLAKVDEVTRGEGKVVPSSQVQIIQSMDGGVVEEIFVQEGQTVKAGQLLMRIEPTRFVSSLRENQSQALALRARAARLQGLTDGKPFNPPAEIVRDAPDIVDRERQLYESQKAENEAQLSIANQQRLQREQELREAQARQAQASRAYELASQELSVTEPLMKSGAVSEVELLRLRRDVSSLRGERDQASAQIARIQAAIQESNRKIQEVELNFRNQLRNELSETMAKLGALAEGSLALEDKVSKTDIKSPVRGTIKRLLITTQGGVVQPGKEVIEIVPLDDTLLVEAQVRPQDIAFLHPGQPALVKFTAYDFAIYGGLEAKVEHISADTVINDKDEAFYIVRVRTSKSSLGDNLPIIPGMVTQVDILTGEKSILSYLLKPVLRAKAMALTER